MRHSHPGGELGPIVERALDLLIESLMQRRFGKATGPKRARQRKKRDDLAQLDTAEPGKTPRSTTPDSAELDTKARDSTTLASISTYIPRSTRRVVLERDGLSCSWVDEHGVRCGSRAWLEYDHRHPRAKGGGSEPDNLRLLCRQHNRFAAEREYGRRHVEHSIAERRRQPAPHVTPAIGRVMRA